jgi:magnesium chelatase accessory protein
VTPAPHLAHWPPHERRRTVDAGGIVWHVQISGAGPPILLVHGTGASSHSFRKLTPLLARHFTVVTPDLPGHAYSNAPAWFEPSLPATAQAMASLLATLRVEPALAVGHSAGAALVTRMALDGAIQPRLLVGLGAAFTPFDGIARAIFPRTAKLLATASRLFPLRVREARNVERLLRATGSSLDRQGVELYRRLSERPSHVAAVLAMMASWDLEPLFAELPDLQVPLVLIAGAHDRAVPLAQQRAIAARLPRARVRVVQEAGHVVHEEQPETVARLILEEHERNGPVRRLEDRPMPSNREVSISMEERKQ